MNTLELRRLLIVVLPASVLLAVAALLVAFAIDGPNSTGPSVIAKDHWHARYQYIVCGVRQPNAPEWHAGVHTHGDGIIHIHPFTAAEEGSGSRLVKWFEYGGGILTEDQVRLPGEQTTHRNGDRCPDGSTGTIHVYVTPAATGTQEELADWTEYIPLDGDTVTISFGPDQPSMYRMASPSTRRLGIGLTFLRRAPTLHYGRCGAHHRATRHGRRSTKGVLGAKPHDGGFGGCPPDFLIPLGWGGVG